MHLTSRTTFALILAALVTASPALAESRTFDLAPFSEIDGSAGIDIHITQADTQSVTVKARNASDFDHLNLDVTNGKLRAATDYSLLDFILIGGLVGSMFRDGPSLKIEISVPNLNEVNASSGADILVDTIGGVTLRAGASSGADLNLKDITFETVSLSASSGADIDASGVCTSIKGNVSSGADINARKLECKEADANASSGGDLDLFAGNAADANASSGGDVTIFGDPQQLDINTSSGGDVRVKK